MMMMFLTVHDQRCKSNSQTGSSSDGFFFSCQKITEWSSDHCSRLMQTSWSFLFTVKHQPKYFPRLSTWLPNLLHPFHRTLSLESSHEFFDVISWCWLKHEGKEWDEECNERIFGGGWWSSSRSEEMGNQMTETLEIMIIVLIIISIIILTREGKNGISSL